VTEKIQGLTDVPPGKLAGVLADSVPGLATAVIEDLSATGELGAVGCGNRRNCR